MTRFLWALLLLSMAGCFTDRVVLARAGGLDQVACGPYFYVPDEKAIAEIHLRACVEDYEHEGYAPTTE